MSQAEAKSNYIVSVTNLSKLCPLLCHLSSPSKSSQVTDTDFQTRVIHDENEQWIHERFAELLMKLGICSAQHTSSSIKMTYSNREHEYKGINSKDVFIHMDFSIGKGELWILVYQRDIVNIHSDQLSIWIL